MFVRFAAMWLIIIAVASYDTYLTAKHAAVMEDVEINPVGVAVIRSGGVPSLVGMKAAGVALALLFCVALWQCEKLRPKVLLSSYCVATLSIGLVCYMSVDIVGIQTQGWAREMQAAALAAGQVPGIGPSIQSRRAPRDSELAPPSRQSAAKFSGILGTEAAGAVIRPIQLGTPPSGETPLMAAFEKSELRAAPEPTAGSTLRPAPQSLSL